MNKLILLILNLFISFSVFGQREHWVNPYVTRSGVSVQGHYRTNPNNTIRDNYSTYPNINPHTGQIGSKYIYSAPLLPSPQSTIPDYTVPTIATPHTDDYIIQQYFDREKNRQEILNLMREDARRIDRENAAKVKMKNPQ